MFEDCVELVLAHEAAIALGAARKIKSTHVAWYDQLELQDLASRVLPAFHLRMRYLQSNDLTEWRDYCTNLTLQRGEQGVDYQSIILAGECITQAILEFFQAHLPTFIGHSGETVALDKLYPTIERRMRGLTMVGNAVVSGTGIKTMSNAQQNKPSA